ncbi:SIR2 family protein [Agrococcus sp. KRD186]|uniref:SIR2 family protein n=1 Tax=Agrococcus sp. KRD186 TaxID=2729730 RepID=UPI0019D30EBA|nr:SIR2 family protein [Agrococcus sp. KRD186]
MSAPDIDAEAVDRFAALGGDAHLTIVLGAGASAPSGLPQWDEFATRLATLSGLVTTEENARILLSKQDHTIVLEAARVFAGDRWPQLLGTALFGDGTSDPVPSPLHLAAAGHHAQLPDSTTLATLNFDTLLEDAVLTSGDGVVVGCDGVDEPGVPTVHHLHGVVFDDDAISPIVGYRDYAELVSDEHAWQRRFLSAALQRGPILLAGTSYRDPDIRHWLHVILRDERPPHTALVTIAREGLGLDRETFNAIEQALTAEWQSIGLSALTMQDLADVAIVIRELQFAGSPGYRAPRERARQVWSSHEQQFLEVQLQYSQALAEDTKRIASALHVDVHRATLWLADGHGKLARWSTEGHQYMTAENLKRIPTGHDSLWIAGEAIAAEEVKLKGVHRQTGVSPTWQSVLAIPIFVGDGRLPEIAAAVATFGLDGDAAPLLDVEDDWSSVVEQLSGEWGTRLNRVSFT